jgi:hypothetical protein
MQSGATCDNIDKATLKSNRLKLRSTMHMLGISELTGHWQYRQCQVAEQLKVIHRLEHVLSVVEYGQDYLEAENLSRVENCIARSASSTRLYACSLSGRRKVLHQNQKQREYVALFQYTKCK